MPTHLRITCSCGRELRAREEYFGSRIRCWSCHGSVKVPYPRVQARWAREFGQCVCMLPGLGTIGPLLLVALLATAAPALPRWGPRLAIVILAVGGAWLGALLHRQGLGDVEDDAAWSPSLLARWGRLALSAGAGMGLIAPFLLALGSEIGRIRPVGIAVAAILGGMVAPLALLLASAHDRRGPLGARQTLTTLGRHPIAAGFGLLVLPLGWLALEVALVAATWAQGWLPTLSLDLLPPTTNVTIQDDYPLIGSEDFHSAADAAFFRIYLHGLRRGHPLLTVIPASLRAWESRRLNLAVLGIRPEAYRATRSAYTFLIVTGFWLLAALQARWLNRIAILGARRPAPVPIRRPFHDRVALVESTV
jgi:hypothetical protein